MAVLSVIVHSREQLGVARHKFEILEIKELYTALESLNCVCAGGNAERQAHEENCRDATQKYRPAFPSRRRIAIPRDGLGKRQNAMYAFHQQRSIQVAHLPHRRWCFPRRAIAEQFAAEFGRLR